MEDFSKIYNNIYSKMKMEPFPMMEQKKEIPSEQSIRAMVSKGKDMLCDQDYFHKIFLKPIEVVLKDQNPGLPTGLRLVLKDDISSNKYQTTQFKSPNMQQWQNLNYEQIIENNFDNLLSMMKCPGGIQLAICVCMYSQDKKMLKNTLAGVSQNIQYYVRSGISTDKIAVVVVMDGIQKVDSTIPEYFDELQRQSNIILTNQIQPAGIHDLLYQNYCQDLDQEEIVNINNILFTPAELFDRQQRRFSVRVAEYQSVRQLMNLVESLKSNKGLTYDVLDPRIQKFFIEVARQRRKQEYGQDDDQLKSKDVQFFVDNYAYDVVKSRPIIMEALVRARQFCQEYIKSRESLALLNYFRTGVFVTKKKKADQNNSQKQQINDEQQEEARQKASKMNLFLLTKYKNSGKLSSHNWFFNGFCKQVQPKYSILLDVGLRPEKDALYRMLKYMHTRPEVGGVCGYMGLKIERTQDQLGYNDQLDEDQDIDFITKIVLKFADIQRAQQMQYHFAHLIDKPFESQFKFIHVLPGAFSAYNMEALHANNLLEEYFKSLADKIQTRTFVASRFSAFDVIMKTALPEALYYMFWPIDSNSQQQLLYNQNIYLAEDRILCMGIHKNGKDMAFIPDAYAWVDPIKNVHTLLGQRKRWINGSFFAFDKVKKQLSQQQQCQIGLQFQMYFLSFLNTLAYVAPALFLFTVSVAMQIFRSDVLAVYLSNYIPGELLQGFVDLVNFFYVMLTATIVFYSMHLTNRHKKFIPYIYAAATASGIFALIVFAILSVDIIRGSSTFLNTNTQFVQSLPFDVNMIGMMRWIILSIIGMYTFPVLLYVILFRRFSFAIDCLFGAFSFLFFSPTYLNILNIYALSRINDISWGTKGLDASQSSKNSNLQESWKVIRLLHVGKFLLWNIIASIVLLTMGSDYVSRFFITFFIMLLLAITMLIKVVIGTVYMVSYWLSGRVQDPHETQTFNHQSRINDYFQVIKPQLQLNVSQHIENMINQINTNLKNNPKSVILWGGKSKVLAPGKNKQALKKDFLQLKKLNQSRIIKKEPSPFVGQFKGRMRQTKKTKQNYRRKQNTQGTSDKTSHDQQKAMVPKPAKDKNDFKKNRGIDTVISFNKKSEDSKQKSVKKQKGEQQENAQYMPAPNKDKFKKGSKK